MADEFNPMTSFNPLIGMLVASSNTASEAVATDDLRPLPEQYAMGPGDYAVLPQSGSKVDQALCVVALLDPESEEVRNEFKDWETRLMNSYVPVFYTDTDYPEGYTCWVSRVKLIPLEETQYKELQNWISTETLPEEPPAWLGEAYDAYQDKIAETTGAIPGIAHCPKCNSKNLMVHFTHVSEMTAEVGSIPGEANKFAVMDDTLSRVCRSHAVLMCQDCSAQAEVDMENIHVNPNSRLGRTWHH